MLRFDFPFFNMHNINQTVITRKIKYLDTIVLTKQISHNWLILLDKEVRGRRSVHIIFFSRMV